MPETMTLTETTPQALAAPPADDVCWQAVTRRDADFDGRFVVAVKTTGIYCRPSCAARQPLRRNVAFFADPDAAELAGFRACKRCKPRELGQPLDDARIRELCDYLRAHADSGDDLSLAALGRRVHLSPGFLQRRFRQVVGISPRQFLESCRLQSVKDQLKAGDSVTDAVYGAGLGAASRLYEKVDARFGMTPGQYQKGGRGVEISYTLLDSPFGLLALAATDRGLCLVEFGDSPDALRARIREEFPGAKLSDAAPSAELERWRDALADHLRGGAPRLELPLDIRATAFQSQVWRFLQQIPRGETRSYGEVAAGIGRPTAVRAVASACAKNPTALVVPCHRVIRGDGHLGEYRWGAPRKRHLLRAEGVAAATP